MHSKLQTTPRSDGVNRAQFSRFGGLRKPNIFLTHIVKHAWQGFGLVGIYVIWDSLPITITHHREVVVKD